MTDDGVLVPVERVELPTFALRRVDIVIVARALTGDIDKTSDIRDTRRCQATT